MDPLSRNQYNNDQEYIDALNEASERLCRNEPSLAEDYAEKALEVAERKRYISGIARSKINIGFANCWLTNINKALIYCLEAIEIYDAENMVQEMAASHYKLAAVYYYANDYNVALGHFKKSLSLSVSIKDELGIATANNGIGTVYYTIGKNELALDHLNKAFETAKKLDAKNLMGRIFDGLTSTYSNLGEYEKAIKTAKKSEKISLRLGDLHMRGHTYMAIGKANLKLENLKESKDYYTEALTIWKSIPFEVGITNVKVRLGEVALRTGNVEEALNIFLDLYSEVLDQKKLDLELELLRFIGECQKSLKLFDEYVQTMEKTIVVQDAIADQNTKKQLDLMDMAENVAIFENKELARKSDELKKANDGIMLLTEIGKEIAAITDMEELTNKIYEKLNELLDASVLAISLFDKKTQTLEVPCTIEKGEKLPKSSISLEESERLAVICFSKGKELVLNDYVKDYTKYSDQVPAAYVGENPESVIYFPLFSKDEVIGTFTVQSFNKNAYGRKELDLMRNLAVYISISAENSWLVNNLEEEVAVQTREVLEQKESLEKTNTNISLINDLGMEISSLMSFEEMSRKIYEGIRSILPIECFGIGVYHDYGHELVFDGVVEKDEKLDSFTYGVEEDRLASRCFREGKTIHIPKLSDIESQSKSASKVIQGDVPESIIYVPLQVGKICNGVITIQSQKANCFSDQNVNMFTSLAAYISVAINNSRSFENLKNLTKIGKEVTSTFDIERIADQLYDNISRLMDISSFLLATYNNSEQVLTYIRVYEDDEKIGAGLSFNVNEKENLAGYCAKNNEEILTTCNEDVLQYISHQKASVGVPRESIIYIPLSFEDQVVGVLSAQSVMKNAYTEQHLEVLKNIAAYLSVALNNAHSHQGIKNIGLIGQEITSKNSIREINEVVYGRLGEVMSTEGFGIGIYNDMTQSIDFPAYIENGEELEFHSEHITEDRFSTWCYHNKDIVHISCMDDYFVYLKDWTAPAMGEVMLSFVYVPLLIGKRCIGVMTVQSFDENIYSEQDINLIINLAPYVAVALQNARSFENLRSLSNIGQNITSTLNIEDIADSIYQQVSPLMNISSLMFGTFDERTQVLTYNRIYEEGVPYYNELKFNIHEKASLASYSIVNKEEILINEKQEVQNFVKEKIESFGSYPESIVMLPLVFEDRVLGVFSVQSFNKNEYSDHYIVILRNIASYISIAMNNIRSYETINMIGEVGQEITSTLNLETVFGTIYNQLNEMMDVEFLVVALYNKEKHQVEYRYRVEKGKVNYNLLTIDANNENYPGSWCIENKKTIHIGDLENEYHHYVKELVSTRGDLPNSVIYRPLMQGEEIIGLISIQTSTKFAYSDYQVQVLDSLSPYVTSALQNGLTYEKLEQAKGQLEKLSIVARETDNAIIIAKPDGTYEWVNEAFTELTGFRLEDIVGSEKNTIQSLSNFDGINEAMDEVRTTKQSVIYESPLMSAKGDLRWVQTTLTPILNENNELHKLVAIDSDITDMKQAQSALKKSEKDYKTLFEQITDSIFIFDKQTKKFIDCNNAVLNIYGYSKKEIKKMTPLNLHPEEEQERVKNNLETEGNNRHNEYTHITKDGQKIIVDISSEDLYYKGREATLSIVRDITERREFEEKILFQNSELEKLSIVASNTDNVVIISDAQGQIMWANESFEKTYGMGIAQWVEIHGTSLVQVSGVENLSDIIVQCVAEKRGVTYESSNTNKNGDEIWLQSTLTPVFDEQGDLKNLVIIDSDITKQKHAELQIREKNKDITDSINYASRIQKAMLPGDDWIKSVLPKSFVFYSPRDIVSGDFYWMTQVGDQILVAAVDCTGHGVPGAFLTIVGNNLLNQIVNVRGITSPGKILDEVNAGLISRFRIGEERAIKDGMDASICRISMVDGECKVDFAGANNPLYYTIEDELMEIKGNRCALGTVMEEGESFKETTVVLPQNSMFYLFSDGYYDQFGGAKGKKFMKKRFRQLFLEIKDLPAEQQREVMSDQFEEWKDGFDQVDDVLVIGIRV